MKEFLTQFRQCALFDRIDDEGLLKTMNCLNVQVMSYEKGRVIFHQGDAAKYFGVVLRGSIHVVKNHSNGSHTLVGAVDEGDLFAESCVCAGEALLPASFIAAKDSLIAVFDHVRVINGCRNNGCLAHSMLVVNLMRSIARKNLTLSQKLGIVTQRTTRDKLMSYLNAQNKQESSDWFAIPFDRQALADYLGVDRSAMSAELSNMKKDGLIDYRKNEFLILDRPKEHESDEHKE